VDFVAHGWRTENLRFLQFRSASDGNSGGGCRGIMGMIAICSPDQIFVETFETANPESGA
jgi:hypothetical protein